MLLDETPTKFTCRKTGREFSSKRGLTNHIRLVYKDVSHEEIYLSEHSLNEPLKCKFCGKNRKFQSISVGYHNTCCEPECIKLIMLESNRKIAEDKRKGIIGYDQIILDNKELYISAFKGETIVDPYDGMLHNNPSLDKSISTRYITQRSETSLKGDIFYEHAECKYCSSGFKRNIITEPNKSWCSNDCALMLNLTESKIGKANSIDNYTHSLKNMSNYDFSRKCSLGEIKYFPTSLLYDNFKRIIYRSYSRENSVKVLYDEKSQLYCNIVLNRGRLVNHTLKLLNAYGLINKLDYVDSNEPCSVCGCDVPIKFSFKLDSNDNFISNRDSKYVYCSPDCYKEFLQTGDKNSRYEYLESRKLKQSELLKSKILDGSFVPNTTNSWCKTRIEFEGNPFRSTWEYMFYIYAKETYSLIEFETIRIPYFSIKHNKNRIYIVDFCLDEKILVEVKPKELQIENVDKFDALYDYAIENDYEVLICDEDFFKSNLTIELFDKMIKTAPDSRIKTLLKKYMKEFCYEIC
jgi:hypothetical protein